MSPVIVQLLDMYTLGFRIPLENKLVKKLIRGYDELIEFNLKSNPLINSGKIKNQVHDKRKNNIT